MDVSEVRIRLRLSPGKGIPAPGRCCAFSPNGAYLAIGRADGRCVIWDCYTRSVAQSIDIAEQAHAKSKFNRGDSYSQSNERTSSSCSHNIGPALSEAGDSVGGPLFKSSDAIHYVEWSRDSRTLICLSASMSWVLATVDVDSGNVLRFFDFGKNEGDPYPVSVEYHPTRTDDVIVCLSEGSVLFLSTLTGCESYFLISSSRKAAVPREAWPTENLGIKEDVANSLGHQNQEKESTCVKRIMSDDKSIGESTSFMGKNRASVISPDGTMLFLGVESEVVIFDTSSRIILSRQEINSICGKQVTKLNTKANSVESLTVDGRGQLLVVNIGNRCLRIFGVIVENSVEDGDQSIRPAIEVTLVWTGVELSNAVDPRGFRIGTSVISGKYILAASTHQQKLHVWEASTGRHICTISDHWRTDETNLGVLSLASHPERVMLASCAVDGTVCFWWPPIRQDWSIQMQGYDELVENHKLKPEESSRNDEELRQAESSISSIYEEEKLVNVFLPAAAERLYFIRAAPKCR